MRSILEKILVFECGLIAFNTTKSALDKRAAKKIESENKKKARKHNYWTYN